MIVPLEKPGTPEELVHAGVKGMKWGVRKKEETSSGTSSPDQKRHLSSRQKKVLIGAGVAATVLAAYGTYKLTDSGQARQMMSAHTPFQRNSLLSRKMSVDQIMTDVVKPINPEFGAIGTKMNCRRATFAYEMRRRGLDVKATRSVKGGGQGTFSLLTAMEPGSRPMGRAKAVSRLLHEPPDSPAFRIAEAKGVGIKSIGKGLLPNLEPREKSQWIFDQIGKHPEGARGELGLLDRLLVPSIAWRGKSFMAFLMLSMLKVVDTTM